MSDYPSVYQTFWTQGTPYWTQSTITCELSGSHFQKLVYTTVLTSLHRDWAVGVGYQPGRNMPEPAFICLSPHLSSHTSGYPPKDLVAPQSPTGIWLRMTCLSSLYCGLSVSIASSLKQR